MKVRYVIGYLTDEETKGSVLVGFSGSTPMSAGWYRMKFDDEGRYCYEGGPHTNVEDAMRIQGEP
jgi:hypothetical protein